MTSSNPADDEQVRVTSRRRKAVASAAYLQRGRRRPDAAARRRPGVEPARVVGNVEVDGGAVGRRGTGTVARHHVADVGLIRAAYRVDTGNHVAFCDTHEQRAVSIITQRTTLQRSPFVRLTKTLRKSRYRNAQLAAASGTPSAIRQQLEPCCIFPHSPQVRKCRRRAGGIAVRYVALLT